jgi:hypothetical protein
MVARRVRTCCCKELQGQYWNSHRSLPTREARWIYASTS